MKTVKQDIVKVQLTDNEVSLLRQTLSNKVFSLLTNGANIEDKIVRADYFSLLLKLESKKLLGPLKEYLTIEADYNLSKQSSTTFYKFDIYTDTKPNKIKTDKNTLFWPFVEVKTTQDRINKIEVYQDYNEEFQERIEFDCGLLFYMDNSSKILLSAFQTAQGGVCYIADAAEIKETIVGWTLRLTIE